MALKMALLHKTNKVSNDCNHGTRIINAIRVEFHGTNNSEILTSLFAKNYWTASVICEVIPGSRTKQVIPK